MKYSKSYLRIGLFLVAVALLAGVSAVQAEEHFGVKEYNQFHDVLHGLQHEALPAKDFQRIRANPRNWSSAATRL